MFILEAKISRMRFGKGCSRKYYWDDGKPTLEETPAFWNRLSGMNFWLP